MLLGNALTTGIETHRTVLAGKTMDVRLETEKDFPLTGIDQTAVRQRVIMGAIISGPLAPLQKQTCENIGKTGQNTVGSLRIRILYNKLERLAQFLEIQSLILINTDKCRLLIMQHPLPETTPVRTADLSHDIFRIHSHKNDNAVLRKFHILQNLPAENDKETSRLRDIIPLLDPRGNAPALAENTEGQCHLHRKPKSGHINDIGFITFPIILQIVQQTELLPHPHLGNLTFEIIDPEC